MHGELVPGLTVIEEEKALGGCILGVPQEADRALTGELGVPYRGS